MEIALNHRTARKKTEHRRQARLPRQAQSLHAVGNYHPAAGMSLSLSAQQVRLTAEANWGMMRGELESTKKSIAVWRAVLWMRHVFVQGMAARLVEAYGEAMPG